MSTLLNQYTAIKVICPDAILLFRAGDYCETFGTDAAIVLQHFDIRLTQSSDDELKVMADVPFYELDERYKPCRRQLQGSYVRALRKPKKNKRDGKAWRNKNV